MQPQTPTHRPLSGADSSVDTESVFPRPALQAGMADRSDASPSVSPSVLDREALEEALRERTLCYRHWGINE